MTETNDSLGGVQPVEEAEASRRPVLLVGGLVAALVLGGGGYVLLTGGSSESDDALVVRHSAPSRTQTTANKPAAPVVVPALSRVQLGRDPFKPLYVVPAADPAAVPGAPTGSTGGTPTTGGSTTTGGTTGSGSTGSGTGTVTPATKTHALVLTKVTGSGDDQTASFTVDGRTMVAKVGSVFGPTSELKLLSLSQNEKGVWVATIQVGDSEPVDATKGETLYVR